MCPPQGTGVGGNCKVRGILYVPQEQPLEAQNVGVLNILKTLYKEEELQCWLQVRSQRGSPGAARVLGLGAPRLGSLPFSGRPGSVLRGPRHVFPAAALVWGGSCQPPEHRSCRLLTAGDHNEPVGLGQGLGLAWLGSCSTAAGTRCPMSALGDTQLPAQSPSSPSPQMQEEHTMEHSEEPLQEGKEEEEEEEGQDRGPQGTRVKGSLGRMRAVLEEGTKVEEEEKEGDEDEDEEEEEEEEEEDWELQEEVEVPQRKVYSMTDSFEEELMAQLEEYERLLMEFQNELEVTRTRYALATGRVAQHAGPGNQALRGWGGVAAWGHRASPSPA